MTESADEIKTEGYLLRHYRTSDSAVVVCFSSLAGNGIGEKAEEFRYSLQREGVSSIHVTDLHGTWFNQDDTSSVFEAVDAWLSDYKDIGVTGQSMGGSGAILFTNFTRHLDKISRILSFSPQYAISEPFIRFDDRYRHRAAKLPKHYHLDFGTSPVLERCHIIFGNLEWRDYLHSAMFEAAGFRIVTIDGGTHEVGAYLRWSPSGNLLRPLISKFCDFSTPFDDEAVSGILRPLRTSIGIQDGKATVWKDTLTNLRPKRPIPAPESSRPNIAIGKPAAQSSTSPWSRASSTDQDAAGAVNGEITGTYSFHTAYQRSPWWMVDLQAQSRIDEIRIFNALDSFEATIRSNHLRIDVATVSPTEWQTLFTKTDAVPFGGADGYPFVFRPNSAIVARYVRITLLGINALHLDEVQIFGEKLQ